MSPSLAQLTPYGLSALHDRIADNTLAVFFRNNHFCTGALLRRASLLPPALSLVARPCAAYKHRGGFYLLVTDEGYRDQSQLVWEALSTVRHACACSIALACADGADAGGW